MDKENEDVPANAGKFFNQFCAEMGSRNYHVRSRTDQPSSGMLQVYTVKAYASALNIGCLHTDGRVAKDFVPLISGWKTQMSVEREL